MSISEFDLQNMQRRVAHAAHPQAAAALDAAKADKWAKGEERKLSAAFCAFLTTKGIPHIVSRTDRKSCIAVGWPDVTALWQGRVACVELKCEGNKLSYDQEICIAGLRITGTPVIVAYNLKEACDFIIETLLK